MLKDSAIAALVVADGATQGALGSILNLDDAQKRLTCMRDEKVKL